MAGLSPRSAAKATEKRGPNGHVLSSPDGTTSCTSSTSSFMPPRLASTLSRPQHAPIRDVVHALATTVAPGTVELPSSFCTGHPKRTSYWAPKATQDDPFLQKVLAAKSLQLERAPFRDAYLYQYGVLPDQYRPPRNDHGSSLHPCDKVDAKLSCSLLQREAAKQLQKGVVSSERRVVSPWDGTMKNVTAPLLWRAREPLF